MAARRRGFTPARARISTCRALRAGGYPPERLPAIALTAYSRAEDRHDAIEAGFQMHLSKPINVDALTAAIAKLGRPLVRKKPLKKQG